MLSFGTNQESNPKGSITLRGAANRVFGNATGNQCIFTQGRA